MKKFISVIFLILIISSLALADEEMQAIGDTAGEVADLMKSTDFKGGKSFQFSFNAIPQSMNQNVDNDEAAGKIDDSAHHYEIGVVWKSNKKDPLGMASATQTYLSLHMLRYTQSGVDEEGYPWAEKSESTFFIYGNRYYSDANYNGPGYGWYAGIGTSQSNPGYWWYDYDTNNAYPYSEERAEVILAAEVFYKYTIDKFFIMPRVAGGLNKKDFGFSLFPEIMLGVEF